MSDDGYIARQIYPSVYATSQIYPNQHLGGSGTEAEPEALKCAQCGAPIEDALAISECWFCLSDNFRGRRYSRAGTLRRGRFFNGAYGDSNTGL